MPKYLHSSTELGALDGGDISISRAQQCPISHDGTEMRFVGRDPIARQEVSSIGANTAAAASAPTTAGTPVVASTTTPPAVEETKDEEKEELKKKVAELELANAKLKIAELELKIAELELKIAGLELKIAGLEKANAELKEKQEGSAALLNFTDSHTEIPGPWPYGCTPRRGCRSRRLHCCRDAVASLSAAVAVAATLAATLAAAVADGPAAPSATIEEEKKKKEGKGRWPSLGSLFGGPKEGKGPILPI
ncbi:hypothetical protein BJ166DRAFT_592911 [Pestalotiopsis sp. NC0098]|nr:hypothetical protein BJ166DRAFT_592911 [Pestalotiopsis sp. NC0098]